MQYFILYKPYGTICQFSPDGQHPTLADLDFNFPKDCYPVGRLDTDSEGLLIICNNPKLNAKLLHPESGHWRTYYVQVEGEITNEALNLLRQGSTIAIKGKQYRTKACKAERLANVDLPERHPPIRIRKTIPVSWISLSLTEGKNRQVRRMTAKVNFPTLRLVRYSIEDITIQGFTPGEVREIEESELFKLLKIKAY